jgi:serine/threonine kinase 16
VQSDASMDARSDVWSLGCLLFAIAFGWSPFECTFTSQGLKYVDCSYLRVIGKVNFPDPCRYSQQFCDLILWILNQNIAKRPHVYEIIARVKQRLHDIDGKPTFS